MLKSNFVVYFHIKYEFLTHLTCTVTMGSAVFSLMC